MEIRKISLFSAIFQKIAQAVDYPDKPEVGDNITQQDETWMYSANDAMLKSNQILFDWINGKVGVNATGSAPEMQGYIDNMKISADALNNKVNTYLSDASANDPNRTVSTLEADLNTIVTNHNNLRPYMLKDNWLTIYEQSDEAKAFNEIEKAGSYMKNFIAKAKNEEATSGDEPPLPD